MRPKPMQNMLVSILIVWGQFKADEKKIMPYLLQTNGIGDPQGRIKRERRSKYGL